MKSRKVRKSLRKVSRKASRKSIRKSRKASRKSRRKSRKASRKSRRKSRKSSRKSRRKSRKASRKYRRSSKRFSKAVCIDLSIHGKNASERKKYANRDAPPFSANGPGCQGLYTSGNDGKEYKSVENVNGIFVWKKV